MKNIIITISFVLAIFLGLFTNVIAKDKQISSTERRTLAQFPDISVEKILNGDVTSKWEKYVEDQFVGRDLFRSIKSFWSFNIFGQKDNNQLFEKDNAIYKMEYPMQENNIKKSAQKINAVYQKYLQNMDVYYAIIPDKNYYLKNDDHLKIDYNRVVEIFENELTNYKYIDISKGLKLEDFYRTDLHWKQEKLDNVVEIIKKEMKLNNTNEKYSIIDKGEFYGAYYGQYLADVEPDKLYILTNETIEKCNTFNYETQKNAPIYTETKSADRYDVFVSGATSLITIENPNANNNKELLLFRDSFGSSIAPLLIENYSKITLIDLRYISSQLLDKYIIFEGQDVLFLYSTVVLNQNVFK